MLYHKFTDSTGRLFLFRVKTKRGFSSSLEMKTLTTVLIYQTSFQRFLKELPISEDIINDAFLWHKNYSEYPEEFRIYLKKFVKLLAFC